MSRPLLNSLPFRRVSLRFSSDEDMDEHSHAEQTQYSTPRAVELIDLTSPDVSPAASKQLPYIPRTLKYGHLPQQRLTILPIFPPEAQPTTASTTEVHLLLANVSQQQLSIEQMARRQSGYYQASFTFLPSIPHHQSFLQQKYHFFFEPLMNKLKVDMRILDLNYTRLEHVLRLYSNVRHHIFNQQYRSSNIPWHLNESEYPLLLEFFLQIDVDLFYMKTCSFRNAQPRSTTTTEGLFCQQSPDYLYAMKACGHCELCHRSTARSSLIQFDQYQRHRFVNGYEAILNCPATCSSTNIIYVLTCPCGQFDFVGESSKTLAHCLRRHRQFGNVFLHEFLIGERNRQRAQGIQQSSEMASKSRMRLYQHSIRCPTAIQLFLNANPQYWPFIPILEQDALRQNRSDSMRVGVTTTTTTTTMAVTTEGRDRLIEQRLTFIPVPPRGYQFTDRQLAKQYAYFEMKLDSKLPDERLDLYDAKIIALLPLNCSDAFRQFIHALFVTHAETKLNTMGHLFDPIGPIHVHERIWCENLHRPSNSSSMITRRH